MEHISTFTAPILELFETEMKLNKGLFAAKNLTTAHIAGAIVNVFGENGAKNIANAVLQAI